MCEPAFGPWPLEPMVAEATPDYPSDEIGRCLAQWPRLQGLAEGGGSASVLQLGSGGSAGDHRHWADTIADIERAWIHLPFNSLGQRIVEARMQGYTLSAFAGVVHVRKSDVLDAYREALERMSAFLDGKP